MTGKKEEFHFDKSKVRSDVRLCEGRARPIDILTKHINGSADLDIEINEPYMVFKVNIYIYSSSYLPFPLTDEDYNVMAFENSLNLFLSMIKDFQL
ncbi:hypothetical protein VIGAN_04156200 [Vigna angularis var. angularis]|uniref:Splicing factor cactin central domain-containing protein n=1 Tax=Vigna angularis var. angularis TaxID=157739 RepID=A0A0S3RUG7_PHAAN|nr:hypothetical protein VIGAN_04156200 [Vigna angularis var. angularis]